MSCRNVFIQEFTFGNIISSTTLSFAAPHIYRRATHAKNSPHFCPVPVWPWRRFRTESLRRWKRLQHPESRSILWSLSSSVECLPWGVKSHPTQQRSRGKHVRKMTPAVFVHLKRSTQNAAGRDSNGFTGWSCESPAAAFCCSHMQKHTNHLKFKASVCVWNVKTIHLNLFTEPKRA